MRRTELPREIRKIRFEEAYERQNVGQLTPPEAAQLLGLCSAVSGGAWCAMKPTNWRGGSTGGWSRCRSSARKFPFGEGQLAATTGRRRPFNAFLVSGRPHRHVHLRAPCRGS